MKILIAIVGDVENVDASGYLLDVLEADAAEYGMTVEAAWVQLEEEEDEGPTDVRADLQDPERHAAD